MDLQLIIFLGILAVTIVLIVTEWFRIDVVAIMAMLSLVWAGSITPEQARSGFASNAVLAVMGVMIMGRGLQMSGITDSIAGFILRAAGTGKRQIISMVSFTVGVMSGFMQNIGAAALFLPVLMVVSRREKISISSLLMPMGYAALLGGTLTMVGTSSLIILNDLLTNRGLDPFGLFSVTPVGIVLLLVGVGYFFVFGSIVLPSDPGDPSVASPTQKLLNVWGLSGSTFTFQIPPESSIVGKQVRASTIAADHHVNLLRVYSDESDHDIWKGIRLEPGQNIVVQGREKDVESFADEYDLEFDKKETLTRDSARGYVEVVIPARSHIVGKTIGEVRLRETHNTQVVIFFSGSEVVEEGVTDRKIQAGDTMVLHGKWENLQFFEDSEDFIGVTPFKKHEPKRPEKAWLAVSSFIGAIGVVLMLNLPISVGFLTGALAMILGGVLTIEDAYRAIEWKVIFLIGGLIPIGLAMETSGAASLIAQNLATAIQGMHPFMILLVLGILTTAFSLIMSNVAATVLMVPLVLELSGIGGLDPRVLVLQVGVCAANSFIIPTHHVNALLMTPGGYRIRDYLRAGSLLSLLFVAVSAFMLYYFYT